MCMLPCRKMEFRFFFPLLLPSDDWIPQTLREEYENRYNRMKTSFLEKIEIKAAPETRCDSYYIGGDSVGVKLRVRYENIN
jgi:hypothetical protein